MPSTKEKRENKTKEKKSRGGGESVTIREEIISSSSLDLSLCLNVMGSAALESMISVREFFIRYAWLGVENVHPLHGLQQSLLSALSAKILV